MEYSSKSEGVKAPVKKSIPVKDDFKLESKPVKTDKLCEVDSCKAKYGSKVCKSCIEYKG